MSMETEKNNNDLPQDSEHESNMGSQSDHPESNSEEPEDQLTEGGELIAKLEAELDKYKEEAADFKDRYFRAIADTENLRKRHEKERSDLLKFGSEKILNDILPVLDSFEKALADSGQCEGENQAIYEGIKMVNRQLLDVLEKHGLQGFDSAGKEFDPNLHQAIQRIDDSSVEVETVKDEYQKGYLLNERLLRPAMVSVAVPSEAAGQGD